MELEIRQAKESDLARVQAMYARLVARMDRDGWNVWSDTYPRDAVGEDIKKGWFYLLLAGETLCGAFALPPHDNGEGDVPWRDSSAPARYLYRFGIAPEQGGQGLGKQALGKIEELCGALGARYLRLYVAYENQPAKGLYRKAGFVQLPGEFGELLEDGTRLFEYAFEKEVAGKGIKQRAWEAALSQLATDYNAQAGDFLRGGVTLTAAADLPGRRHYADGAPFFQMATTGNGVVITAHESLHRELRAWAEGHLAEDGAGHWLFEYPKLRDLDRILGSRGWAVNGTHHMFLPRREFSPRLPEGFAYRWYDREAVKSFYPNKAWPNAILEEDNPPRPDVIALAAFEGETPAALCGASADGELLWQVGIDVLPPYRSRGLGRALVEALSARIVELGKVPFYGTAAANVHSQGIAVNCGFFPAWVEVSSRLVDG